MAASIDSRRPSREQLGVADNIAENDGDGFNGTSRGFEMLSRGDSLKRALVLVGSSILQLPIWGQYFSQFNLYILLLHGRSISQASP